MRLAILGSRGFPSTYGGYETLVRHLARDWTRRGHEVTVYCRSREGRRRVWLSEGVRCIWTPGRDSKSLSTLSFGASAHMDASLRRYDAALVLNVANGFYLPLLRARGIPTVVNTDGIEWERGKWGPLARSVFYRGAALTARFANALVADSQAIARVWSHTFGVQSTFIPYGAPVIDQAPDERVKQLGLQPRSYVLVVARLIPENNVDLTLDALQSMSWRRPAVIVGSSDYHSPLKSRLEELNCAGQVCWLGHVGDQELLMQLWANCGAYVHGHSVGGTNPALLQALGAGAPTLALDTEFNREVIDCDEQLFQRDHHKLARLLEDLLDDAQKRHGFTAHGREVIGRRYSWDSVCGAYLDVLDEVRNPWAVHAGVRP